MFVFYVLLSLLCVDLCILDCDAGVLDYLFHSSLAYSVIVDVVIFGTFLTLQLVWLLNAYFLYALYHWVCFIHLCLLCAFVGVVQWTLVFVEFWLSTLYMYVGSNMSIGLF